MTRLFGRDRTVITKHIINVFKKEELDKKSNVQKMHIPKSDKPVAVYSLDVVISVGYRVKSKRVPNFVNGPHSGFCRYRCSGWRSPEGNNSNGKNKICNEEQESDGEVRRAQAA